MPGKTQRGWVIQADQVSKAYHSGREQIPVLRGLSLSLAAGEAVAVVGPSGSGKSTLLNLLSGLQRPDAGQVQLFGRELWRLSDGQRSALRRQRVATLFQDGNLIPTLSLARNLAFRRALAGRPPQAWEPLLRALGIEACAGRYPEQLSGGQRQRAALACALAMEPELLLADEPTGSLDQQSAEQVMPLLFDTIRGRALSALIVTHNLQLAHRCDRVLTLTGGVLKPWDSSQFS